MKNLDIRSKPIVFFGTDAFSVPSLIRLITEQWNVVAVVTKPDSHTGRGRHVTEPAVKRLADAQSIPVFQPVTLTEITSDLYDLKAEIGIVVAYGKIIPPSILKLFPKQLVNVHASLLPRYRGASPIEAALLAGDNETGVTLMQLEEGLDTGPTFDTAKIQLDGTENREELYVQLAELGAEMLAIRLPAILQDQIVPIPQDATNATTVGRIKKSDGFIDWAKPATVLEREIRAYYGWPSSRTTIAGNDITITKAHLEHDSGPSGLAHLTQNDELAVFAGTGRLVIDLLKPAGKREMPARDFLAGHPL